MKESYEQKVIRFSKLHYLRDNYSDFSKLSVSEFECWKISENLDSEELIKDKNRRRLLTQICDSLIESYKSGELALMGKTGLFTILTKICTESDTALLGKTILSATQLTPKKEKGRSKTTYGLKRSIRNLLLFLKEEKAMDAPPFSFPSKLRTGGKTIFYPGENRKERIALIFSLYESFGLAELVQSENNIEEIIRKPRKNT